MSGRGRALRLAPLALVAVGLAGCATITYEAPLIESMVAMNQVDPASYERVGTFEVDRRAVFVVASLITVMDAELEDAIRTQLARADADAVVNLRVHEEYDIIDVAVALVAGGLVNSRALTLEGDLVRWTSAGAPEELLELSDRCRSIDVPTEEGGVRPGYACLP